jgi:hypothetical protein
VPEEVQPVPTVLERLAAAGVGVRVVLHLFRSLLVDALDSDHPQPGSAVAELLGLLVDL